MPAIMLPPSQLPIHMTLIDRRHLRSLQRPGSRNIQSLAPSRVP
jgi:hypothetical protein